MNSLENLYSSKSSCDNAICSEGECSILKASKPTHSFMDYEEVEHSDVLFLSDSLKYKYGEVNSFSSQEVSLLEECTDFEFALAASVKCPSVREADMSPTDMKTCRTHLEATIDAIRPKLVMPCGNLAMKMLIKKSGITDKRGSSYSYETPEGTTCMVVPIYHPYSVIKEPRHRYLFETDIKNAYDKYVLGNTNSGNFEYKVLMTMEEVTELAWDLRNTNKTIAVDLETTGLNFLTDKIQTVGISSEDGNWVIPVNHKDSPFAQDPALLPPLQTILENPNNKKVFHNAKFDLKFLINYGIRPTNVWDTKIMQHLLDENVPKSLMDLVKMYFPTELENL